MPEDTAATDVVTAFVRNRGEILLLRRSDAVGTYQGQWGGVSGFAEGDPDQQVRTEIREETGLDDAVSLVRSGRPVEVRDPAIDRSWRVHPFLCDAETRDIALSEEHDAAEWVSPTVLVDSADDRTAVPKLWTAYERVAPTVRSIAADDTHGAAWLSARALEVLRDRAGLLCGEREETGPAPQEEWDELAALAGRLLEARPSMAVLRNRVHRVMSEAATETDIANGGPPERSGAPAVHEAAIAGIDRALAADADAASTAVDRVDGTVMTLSRSGTVLDVLCEAQPSRVFVAESRPDREGVDVAETLAGDCPVALHTDAAAAHVLATEPIDRVLIGADTICPDGSVVNKTGTRGLAIAADQAGVPVTVVAATDKVSTRDSVNLESGDRSAVYDSTAAIDVLNPTFDVTPADCVSEIVTERGAIEPTAVEAIAAELDDRQWWRSADETA